MQFHGEPVDADALVSVPGTPAKAGTPAFAIAYLGDAMPPPAAIDGTFPGPDGQPIRVPALTDEDRRTIARWVDLGCPIDLAGDEEDGVASQHGLFADDLRPTLTIASPAAGENAQIDRIVIGALDYWSGLAPDSLHVIADVPIDGAAPGVDLGPRLASTSPGVFELRLAKPLAFDGSGTLTVTVADLSGNVTRLVRVFSLRRER